MSAAWKAAAQVGAILIVTPPTIFAIYVWVLPLLNTAGSQALILSVLAAAVLAFYSLRPVMGRVAALASAIVVAAAIAYLTLALTIKLLDL